ncbi:Ldh family oxidoreductase [Amycolatopsis magusensis]|uniref:LDH2 family malate/lactate/ureidoglycolate dehydrogenase n=1 Tax=Amycolatopsis magusensis TaxID=882444 RepID=A0ABS4PSN3_9PSEU|nr:Ldh family oxidoreductase [Amycolatopsis magusensis]MBP2181869.1 LDH2 family malate/lactate/ureidoglycolate dehydrogenase [Amycolatopsis magusensis]
MTAEVVAPPTVRVPYADLLDHVRQAFARRGVPAHRARLAAEALCYADLHGFGSHGVANLNPLYLKQFEQKRIAADAEPEAVGDLGACAVFDAHRALGLWAAAEAMDSAIERAEWHGIGLVSVRGATHFGSAGFHARRAARHGLVGVVMSNCGNQRIARPPGGSLPLLGTNPLSVAAPALPEHPFVLDMSTTVVPTGRIRAAAREGMPIPPGWLVDDQGSPVTDPRAFDEGRAHLQWLGGAPETGAFKGFGLGLVVELLAASLSGAGHGPAAAALTGDRGQDDDIGFFVLAIAPQAADFAADVRSMFGAVLDCPGTVRYPGWAEAEQAAVNLRDGIPLPAHLHAELGLATP